MEGQKLATNEGLTNGDRKLALQTEFGALRRDWFKSKGIDIEGKKYSEIKKAIQLFYVENSGAIKEVMEAIEEDVETELEGLSARNLDFKRLAEIRKKLDLPKYVSLSEAVAFIKTVMDLSDEGITERYAEYCASGISLDDMRNTLAYENDVKPVRLDTDIYHQSPERTRSAVEIVSNAIDAMNQTGITIGRFGVGFYQILSHLKEGDDFVKVTTGNEETGFYEISFKLEGKEIKFHLQEVEGKRKSGTIVELHVKDFPKDEAETLVKKHFAFNSGAKVKCNGKQVNNLKAFGVDQSEQNTADIRLTEHGFQVADSGIGMSPQVILEKLLVPKISGKKPIQEMMDLDIQPTYMIERGGDKSFTGGRVVVNVGGVVIEEIPLTGINVLKTLVIDLPPFTLLGEERNQVAVDEITIKAMKKVIDDITTTGDIQLLNSLSSVVFSLQKRSQKYDKEHNMVSYLRDRAQKSLSGDTNYLPNVSGFERVDISNIVLIDPIIKQTNWNTIPGFSFPKAEGDGISLVVTSLVEKKDEPVVRYGNRLVLDRKLYLRYQEDPTVLNIYLEAFSKGNDVKVKDVQSVPKEKNEIGSKTEQKEKETHRDFTDFCVKNLSLLRCDNEDTARMWSERLHPIQKEKSVLVFKYIINRFPPEYAIYFVDAVFSYNQYNLAYSNAEGRRKRLIEQERLSEENLKNISSLADSPELPKLFADLGIMPIQSLDLEVIRLEGIKEPDSWSSNYNDLYRDNYNDFPSGTRDKQESSLDGYDLKYWDRYNLVLQDGTVIPGSFMGFNDRLLYIIEDGEVRFYDIKNKEYTPVTINIGKKEISQFQIENFGDKKLMIFSYGELVYEPGEKFYGHDCRIFDTETGKRFDPALELGKVVRYESDHEHKIGKKFLIYKKTQKGKDAEYNAYYEDGSIEKIEVNSVWELEHVKKGYLTNIEGDKFSLLIGGKLVHEERFPQALKECEEDGRGESEGYLKGCVEHQVQIKIIDGSGGKYYIWRSHNKLKKEVTFPINVHGNYYHDDNWNKQAKEKTFSMSVVVFGEDGKELFSLEPNENIKLETENDKGEIRFLIFKYKDVTNMYGGLENTYWSNLLEYYVVDINGERQLDEELKLFPPINFRFNNAEGTDDMTENSTLSHGDKWRIGFDYANYVVPAQVRDRFEQSRRKHFTLDQKAQIMRIIDSGTGKELVNENFKSIYYNPETKLWECLCLEYEEKDGKVFNKILYVDTNGSVVREGLIGEKEKVCAFKDTLGPAQLRLLDAHNSLSEVKAKAVEKVLESSLVENSQQYRRFLNRVFKYAYLSDESYSAIIPTLLYFRDVEKHVLTDAVISETETRTKEFDEPNRIWFYQFLMKTLNPDFNSEETSSFIGKLYKVFKDKVAVLSEDEKKELYDTFQTARAYGQEYIVNGWNIVKFKTPVPPQQIPEKIRPIVDFLRSNETTMFSQSKEGIVFTQSSQFTLSQLIQTKRLNETQMQEFSGNTMKLEQLIRGKVEGKKQDHIQREIIHPIYYQSVNNPYLFIRELVQNAHDAVIQNGLKSEREKSVAIDIFSRESESITLRIEDHVGMSLGEVLNYFLIPGETTKIGQKDVIGYFGQGLFTLFRGAKEAILKTSKGDGIITKLRIVPKLDEKGMVSDLDLTVEQENGDFKGTVIERTVNTEYPTVEGAYIKNTTSTFTSLVDGNVIDIHMNGLKLNDKQTMLASVDVPGIGEMKIFDAPNNVIIQRGLYVKGMDADFDTSMKDIEGLMLHRGYVLSIPDSIRLTRSRNEIAQKQETLEKLQKYLPTLKVRAYIEIFRQDIIKGHVIQLKDLPQDYFYWDYNPSQKLINDAEKIRKGISIEDVTDYLERSSLISLLVLLPVVEIGDNAYSLAELKEASLTNSPPLSSEDDYKQIPEVIRERLKEGKKEYDRMHSERSSAEEQGKRVKDFSFEDWQKQPGFITEQMKKQLKEYRSMIDTTNAFNKVVCNSFGDKRSIKTTFYSEPGSKARATQGFGGLGWNLEYWKDWNIRMFGQKNPSDRELGNFLDVWSHEFGHILEESGFTHNPKFYRNQAEALSRFMYERK